MNCRKSFKSREQSSPVKVMISDRPAVWSRTAGSTAVPSESPTFSNVSSAAKPRSEMRNINSLDKRNKSLRSGKTAWTRITPMLFSLNSTAAIPRKPTAVSSKNSSSQVISFLAFCSGVWMPVTFGARETEGCSRERA